MLRLIVGFFCSRLLCAGGSPMPSGDDAPFKKRSRRERKQAQPKRAPLAPKERRTSDDDAMPARMADDDTPPWKTDW